MARPSWMAIAIVPWVGLVVTLGCGDRVGASEADADDKSREAAKAEPLCRVRTVAVRREVLAVDIAASGVVTAAPDAVHSIVLAYDCRVRRVVAQAGQLVATGAALMEVEPSAEAKAQGVEAAAARDTAALDADQVQQRFDLHLATIQELTQAKQALNVATQRVATLSERIGTAGVITAPTTAVVTKLEIQAGQVVPAGTSLIELADAGRLVARIGIDPGDVHALIAGQAVSLTPIRRQDGRSAVVAAQVVSVGMVVEPETRLVAAVVAIPADADLLRGEAVQARIALALPESLVVPRAALVVDDGGGWVVFTVGEGKAHKKAVTIVGENRSDSAIVGEGIAVGDAIVVEGGPELEDGMAVEGTAAP